MKLQGLWRTGLVGGIFAVTLALAAVLPARADVQDFGFSDFTGDYYLTKDSSGRSAMTVTESLTAQFPSYDQNKGIIRAIPMSYDGHSVSLSFDDASLTRNGAPEPVYSKSVSNGNLNVSTGTESYVQGAQTYRFTYHLRDVTKDFGDHQELYWDTNGTSWTQSFNSVTARVHLDPSVASAWNKSEACYQGPAGSNEPCTMETSQDSDGKTMITFTSTRGFGSGENLTLVLGFAKGTFQSYQLGVGETLQLGVVGLVLFAGAASVLWSIVLKLKYRSAKGRGTIVPEYQPPKDISVLVASQIYAKSRTGIAAQIIDLAVRHNLQVVEYEKPAILLFGPTKAYRLRFLNADGMNDDEKGFALQLFDQLVEGQEYDMGNAVIASSKGILIRYYMQQLAKAMTLRGYRYKIPGRAIPIIISVVATIIGFIATALLGQSSAANWSVVAATVSFFSLFINTAFVGGLSPLTEQGAEIRDYVKGLKLYISVAEQDRLQVLQSVTGAEREALGDLNDHAQLVKLYERVLPYAVLLGLEKSWGKVLEQYYAPGVSPVWYVGTGTFSMDNFTSSISSFAASTSSSSSGLGGGGSSGGGGGGGGGGGR